MIDIYMKIILSKNFIIIFIVTMLLLPLIFSLASLDRKPVKVKKKSRVKKADMPASDGDEGGDVENDEE